MDIGGFKINQPNRNRDRNKPMNPFAKNAGAERNRRRDEKAARDRRTNTPPTRAPIGQSSNPKDNDLAKKIAEAKKNLSPSAILCMISRFLGAALTA